MISIYAINPPELIPHSVTGINSRKIAMIMDIPPANIYGLRLPKRPRVLSLINPITGSVIASHNFESIMMVDATPMLIPIVVIYLSNIHDIKATPPPSIRPPIP